jgi:hypothetical protein
MKNTVARKFSSLLPGEQFVEQGKESDWMIKVGSNEAVQKYSTVPYPGDTVVLTKRGQAEDFLKEFNASLESVISAVKKAQTMTQRLIGSELVVFQPVEKKQEQAE